MTTQVQHRRVIDLYIDLLKRAITFSLYQEDGWKPSQRDIKIAQRALDSALNKYADRVRDSRDSEASSLLSCDAEDIAIVHHVNTKEAHALTVMSGVDNLQKCIEAVLNDGIPGDLMECGVWKGGLCVFMRGVLKAWSAERKVWVADSFKGLPETETCLKDAIWQELLRPINCLSVSLEEVKDIFQRYDLFDEQVKFLPGWFDETIPTAPIERLAVLRLDGDYYDSTKVCLEYLYPKLSAGGFLILDNYGIPIGERNAVDEYREKHGITDKLIQVNSQEYYWRKN